MNSLKSFIIKTMAYMLDAILALINFFLDLIKGTENLALHIGVFFSPIKRMKMSDCIKNSMVQVDYRTFIHFYRFEDIVAKHTLDELNEISNICLSIFRNHYQGRSINYELEVNYFCSLVYHIPKVYCLRLEDDEALKSKLKNELAQLKANYKISDKTMNDFVKILYNCFINQAVNGSFSEYLCSDIYFNVASKMSFSRESNPVRKQNIW